MAEYIERDVVIDDIGDLFTICYETLPNEYGHHFIVEKELQTHLDFVRNLPAADVAEVVRCKDCRFCMAFKDKSDGFYGYCRIWITRTISDYAVLVDADGYCSYGERKEGQR